ncbi:MAG TPA: branched-chain amino acid ABC transporter substrate-binding protein [Burkholderiales bacterium]|nr:branched-chain amino acid ABC transporter substrate-binding protein [Burkholderiales bacterium]
MYGISLARLLAAGFCGLAANVLAADTIKIAHIDPQSGPFALQGQSGDRHIQQAIDEINARGGVLGGIKLELVSLDNKSSPQESLVALKQAIDQGIRFVTQGNGSHVGHALTEGVLKHNQRNPGQEVLYLNHAAIDPALTNEKCNFWHFRFDANVDMKIDALTSVIAKDRNIRKIYLINQDYAYGQSVSRVAKEMIARKRPDIQIVGDELHPTGKVKDFAPYIAKIKSSGADTVLTGNWGSDLALLIKAAEEAGLPATFYTNYAYLVGTPKAFGPSGADRVKTVASWFPNLSGNPLETNFLEYKKRYSEDWGFLPIKYAIDMWAKAIDKAGSADPAKVAKALEDMRYDAGVGEAWMRADDHQIMEPLFVATFAKVGRQGVKYDADETGFGWHVDTRIEAKDNILPTTCKMERP